jgi:two-component system, NtrC family, sensor histidine kinase HydH
VKTGTTGKDRFPGNYGLVLFLVVLVSAMHYLTPHGGHGDHAQHIANAGDSASSSNIFAAFHGIYRRLYYFPIILAAFRGGLRLALATSALVVAIYLPHAFAVEWGLSQVVMADPGPLPEKILEIMLYMAMGLVAGYLVDRLTDSGKKLSQTADNLQLALDEKIAMENELVRSARLAAVGRLSAGLAHEIRNPLASIQGSAEMLADDFNSDHPKHKLLTILHGETERLNNVLSRFLAYARSEPTPRKPLDLVAEVKAVAGLLEHQTDQGTIVLELPETCSVLGNAEQVRQVIINLALNAVSMTKAEKPVTISVSTLEGLGKVAVQDSGPGFSPEALDNFGTPFFSSREGGTGLGLATCLRLAEDMGGDLQVDTSYKQGACVILTLPLVLTDGNGDK